MILGFLMMRIVPALASPDRIAVAFTGIEMQNNKNFLAMPQSCDLTITWDLYLDTPDGRKSASNEQVTQYRLMYGEAENPSGFQTIDGIETRDYVMENVGLKKHLAMVVQAVSGDSVICSSDTAWVLTGRMNAKGLFTSSNWKHWIPFNGRIPMRMIGKERIFDESTKAGRIAFHLIWNFGLASLIIWIFFCRHHMALANVFPFHPGISIGHGYEGIYNMRIRREFLDITREWRLVVEEANQSVRDLLKSETKDNCGNDLTLDRIMSNSVLFWQKEGSDRIHKLLDRTDRPDMKKSPAVRIIRAGLANHELGGLHWAEVSREVDRAIENRASSEIENLRRKSLLDWFWNLGTMAPMIGLFGTATGISHAFAMLTFLRTEITQTALVKQLSSGIYEALWTTIMGLFVGIILMLMYYYYQNKLNWIYSKWEEIYVHVSEKL